MPEKGQRSDEPLEMTVHAMPQPDVPDVMAGERTRMGRWKMILVLLICAAPVIASYFTYYVIRPEGRRNFGTLIEPQRPLPALQALTLDGKTVSLPTLKGQWLLISVAGGACPKDCEDHLYLQRQIRETLGREKDRVDWVWLIDDAAPVSDALRVAVERATVLRVPAPELQQWLQSEPGNRLSDHFYLVDPIGNWMMRFPAGINAETAPKVRRDIERVLRASAFWDNAGRQP
jgi:hypothetical protein